MIVLCKHNQSNDCFLNIYQQGVNNMKYFTNSMTLDEVKAAYRKQALRLHPDMGGSNEAMTELTHEFEIAFALAKRNAPAETNETAAEYQREFYTQHGWKGSRYKIGLSTLDIAKIVRSYIKYVHPTYRFSVTTEYFSGGSEINIALMEYPVELTNYELMQKEVERYMRADEWFYIPSIDKSIRGSELTEEQKEEHIHYKLNKKNYHQLNYCYLDHTQWINPIILNVLIDINTFVKSYNYNDSDAMIDYFNTNFYYHLAIGQSDKPAKFVERIARISPAKQTKNVKRLTA